MAGADYFAARRLSSIPSAGGAVAEQAKRESLMTRFEVEPEPFVLERRAEGCYRFNVQGRAPARGVRLSREPSLRPPEQPPQPCPIAWV